MFNRSIRTATRALLATGGFALALSVCAAPAAPAAAAASSPDGTDAAQPAYHPARSHPHPREFGPGPDMWPHGFGRALASVKPTDAQRTELRQIGDALRRDLQAQRDAGRDLHQQALTLYAQPTLDPAAFDALRQRMDEQHAQVSRRVMQATLDAARVLTPEQRAQLAQRLKDQMNRPWRHSGHAGPPDDMPATPAH